MTFVKTYNGELTCLISHRMQHRQSPQLLSVLLKPFALLGLNGPAQN